MNSPQDKIKNRLASVGVIGLGYVGLPLAVAFAGKGLSVTGFDTDPRKIRGLNRGVSYISDVPTKILSQLVRSRRLVGTRDFDRLAGMDAIIICVPTPLRKSKDPDISYIVSAVAEVGKRLKRKQLIVLESTTYPGTTRELVLPALEKKGFKAGRDFFLAFSPERVDPGNKTYGIRNTPKIVGGITKKCAQLAAGLYARIVEKVVPVSSTECAEMVKLLENTFRAVNIALVNEVALMCERLKLNTWEVINAAATKPFGFMPFYPGPGIGGHCIPLDPHYLSWKLKTLNFYSRFIELASEINSSMPEHLVRKISEGLNNKGRSVKEAKILIVGAAYKKDVSDVRESPALDVMELLRVKEARLQYHDPYVKTLSVGGHRYRSVRLTPAVLRSQDCVVIVTNHSALDLDAIVKNARLIVDSRNALKNISNKNIIRL